MVDMFIARIYDDLHPFLRANKALIIYGPRQVGKTTLLKNFLGSSGLKFKLDSGDDIVTREVLGSENIRSLKEYASGYELIAVDEAQRIEGVGLGLKILVDQVPGLKVIATGSSSFALAGQVGEPLTGRKISLTLYPLSLLELRKLHNPAELRARLEEWLIFGGYPEVIAAPDKPEKVRLLEEIAHSYLLKDILDMEKVKGSKVLLDLLRLLAFQVGNEVSLSELAAQVGLDYKTVARYLDLFEKSFVIFNLRGFSRNLRKEITRKGKYYFFDNGVRNAVISNFNPAGLRNDMGCLWENFMFMERMKKRAYAGIPANSYFWRTWDGKEIDLIEERDGKLYGYEFKWGGGKARRPREWLDAYPESSFERITPENCLDFAA